MIILYSITTFRSFPNEMFLLPHCELKDSMNLYASLSADQGF